MEPYPCHPWKRWPLIAWRQLCARFGYRTLFGAALLLVLVGLTLWFLRGGKPQPGPEPAPAAPEAVAAPTLDAIRSDRPSPLDQLDPSLIAPAERERWQPAEVVAILGSGRGQHGGIWTSVSAIAYSPDGKWIASGAERHVRIWDAATLDEVAAVEPHADDVRALAFSPDGKRLAVAGGSSPGWMQLWDWHADNGVATERATFVWEKQSVYAVAFAPDGGALAVGGGSGYPGMSSLLGLDPRGWVQLWRFDGEEYREYAVISEHDGRVRCLAFSPDGGTLAAGADDGRRVLSGWAYGHDLGSQPRGGAGGRALLGPGLGPDHAGTP